MIGGSGHTAALKGKRLVVIEPNAHMARLLRSLIMEAGAARALVTPDPVEALEWLRRDHVHGVLADLWTRPLNGLELTRLIRSAPDSPAPRLPLVLMSFYPERRFIAAARDAGADGFLAKPVSLAQIRDKLAAALTRKAFVACEAYVGPERRRRRGAAPANAPYGERRGRAEAQHGLTRQA